MVNWKRWWTGPTQDRAWRRSGTQADVHIRTWPVKFANRESFELFFAGIYDADKVEVAKNLWALETSCASSGGPQDAEVRHVITSAAFNNRQFHSPDDLLRGQSPDALRHILVAFSVRAPKGTQGVAIHLRGDRTQKMDTRGGYPYVSVHAQKLPGETDFDFPEFLSDVELLLEQHTRPMNLWDRINRKPVVSRFYSNELDSKSDQSRTLRWSALISIVTAAVTALLTGLWT